MNLLLNTKCKHIHNFKFNKVLVLMGCDSQTKTDTVADLIVLLAKQYIYTCKVQETKPTNNVFQNILYRRYQIQKEIPINKDSTQRFTEHWEPYTNIFNPS